MLLALTLIGCGGSEPRDPNDPPPSGNTTHDFEDCDLGIESAGGIIEYGQAQDYLVEFGRDELRVNLARRYEDAGVGESKIFANGGFALKRGEVELCVTDTGKLAYESSHHNWLDAAELTEGGVRYRLGMTLDWQGAGGWKYELFGFDAQSGATLFGPEPLDLSSGPRWP